MEIRWFYRLWTFLKSLVKPTSKTAAYTVDATTFFVACNVTGGGFTVTLPAAADNEGRQICVKKTDASGNTLTVGRTGSDLIDGATTVTTTTQYKTWVFLSDGTTNWFVIN